MIRFKRSSVLKIMWLIQWCIASLKDIPETEVVKERLQQAFNIINEELG